MNCYACNAQQKTTPAVGICIICGMALCPEHVVREELPQWVEVRAGMGAMRRELAETLPRITCAECHRVLSETGE